MMRRGPYLLLILALTLLLLTGCETTKGLKGRVSSFTSSVDDDLFSQVPAEDRQEVRKAEFDLKVAEEKVRLADLKMKLAPLQKKYAGYEEDLANKYRKKAAAAVDLAKLEAIDRSGLGQKEDNIKTIADLQAKRLKIEADMVKIKAKLDTTERRIKDLTKQIEEQAQKIAGMKMLEGQEEEAIKSPSIDDEEQKEEKVDTSSVEEGKTLF